MPFRARIRKAFGRSGSDEANAQTAGATLTQTMSKKEAKAKAKKHKKDEWADWPDNVYKPHELPRPKYRREPEKEHTKKLESFSWEKSLAPFRRNSGVSQYSPMGSRLPSRNSSIIPRLGSSKPPSRSQSLAHQGVDEEDEATAAPANLSLTRVRSGASSKRLRVSRPGTAAAAATEPIQEQSSAERSRVSPGSVSPGGAEPQDLANGDDGAALDRTETARPLDRPATVRSEDVAFSGAELAQALTAIQVKQESAAVGA